LLAINVIEPYDYSRTQNYLTVFKGVNFIKNV